MSDRTGDLLTQVSRELRRRFVAELEQYDVTPGQARALREVCDRGPVRLSSLAEQLRIAPRSATEVVDALEAAGLVRRTPDPHDRRATCVVPTQTGTRVRADVARARRRAVEELLGGLSAHDRAELERILALVAAV